MRIETKNQLTIAYLNTIYGVKTDRGTFHISPLRDNIELKNHCAHHQIKNWALITPMNPRSETLPPAENQARLEAFEKELKDARLRYWESESVLPEGTVAIVGEPMPEKGFLIAHVYPWEAVKLGFRYGQNAILVGTDDGLAELVWTDHESTVYFSHSNHH